jgi:phage shock protein C
MDNQTPSKKLRRSTSQKMVAGVCGGLAEYFGMDPMIMRLLFVVVTLLTGFPLLVYIAMWIIVPEDTAP